MSNPQCKLCQKGVGYGNDLSQREMASLYGVHRRSVSRHRTHLKQETDEFFDEVPKSQITSRGKTVRLEDGSYEKVTYRPNQDEVPSWPVIDRPAPLRQPLARSGGLLRKWKTAVVGADSQIGFRSIDGVLHPFHDDRAIGVFNYIVGEESPDRVLLLGDIIDLPSQGRYAQEASFANTTQPAIDRTYEWMVTLREYAPHARIDFIEGNHDKRLTLYSETNALASHGLRRANWPDGWPVLSVPYLLRLDELDIDYLDAYPNAHVWVNDNLKAFHGTKADAKGSTGMKYLNENPGMSVIFGHSHRLEMVQKTTEDRLGSFRASAVNPGALCHINGQVPGFNSSNHLDGTPARVTENWQNGLCIIRYTDEKSHFELINIDEGKAFYHGEEITYQ